MCLFILNIDFFPVLIRGLWYDGSFPCSHTMSVFRQKWMQGLGCTSYLLTITLFDGQGQK